ncbi:pyridoxal phosphate-dependent decarboxylase family protein [Ferrimonas aestuarii]|uniref:Pyridoxal-dependent decarboxylase n=1 Tax=Ferrimonas aestuarii TaxID=2569539 RepID=A0A4U1BGK2_9GAMM|nr:aspartate aminotransferase family protein [Ferrimonas aestuarii]TKB50119.1 pyridoxal-dependent decarboxylase [Ferrimonas aestuarii]
MDKLSAAISSTNETDFSPTLKESLFTANSQHQYQALMAQAVEQISQHIRSTDRAFTGISVEALSQQFLQIDLDTPLGQWRPALDELNRLYLNDAVHFHHSDYLAHLNCPVTLPSLVGEAIASALNTAVETWDQSAGATLIEQALIDWTCNKIGWKTLADGVFTSGGSQSNLMAMLLARHRICQQQWQWDPHQQGLPPEANKLRIYTSELSHFSVQKAASMLGLGFDAVVTVKADRFQKMDLHDLTFKLEQASQQGLIPMAIVATAGTTDFGSIDPLHGIAALCESLNIWMHVDAAYGGGLLVSEKFSHKLNGIDRADSVTVDYHKSFFQPVACSGFMVKDASQLGCLTYHAEYLNPLRQQQAGIPDLINKSLQTTRRFDALKLWLTLRVLGAKAIGQGFDQLLHLTRQVYWLLLSHPELEVVHQPQISTLVFRFLPNVGNTADEIDALNLAIQAQLSKQGEAVIAATRYQGRQYLKFTLLNPASDIKAIHNVVHKICHYGHTLQRQPQTL